MKKKGIRVFAFLLGSFAIVFPAASLIGAISAPEGPRASRFHSQSKAAPSARLVANPIKPRDGVQKLKYSQEWSVGGENDPQGELLSQPRDIRIGKDGFVFVLDRGDDCIRAFDARGKFIRQIGRKGQGPGEYESPMSYDVSSNNEVFVFDASGLRITGFDLEGKPLRSFKADRFCMQLRLDGRGRLFLGEISSSEPEGLSSEFKEVVQQMTILRLDPDGRNPLRIGPFIGMKLMVKAQGQGALSLSSRNSTITGWGIAPDGRILEGYNEKYEISVHDPDGKILFRFGRDYKPLKSKDSGPGRKGDEVFPAFAPDFFFDDAGNVWLRMFKNEGDKDFFYDVFSPEGIYLKQLVAPFRIYQIRKNKAYALVETEDGFTALRCYRLE